MDTARTRLPHPGAPARPRTSINTGRVNETPNAKPGFIHGAEGGLWGYPPGRPWRSPPVPRHAKASPPVPNIYYNNQKRSAKRKGSDHNGGHNNEGGVRAVRIAPAPDNVPAHLRTWHTLQATEQAARRARLENAGNHVQPDPVVQDYDMIVTYKETRLKADGRKLVQVVVGKSTQEVDMQGNPRTAIKVSLGLPNYINGSRLTTCSSS
jgi:hypothetical protein